MASIFTFDPDPPRISSPWSTPPVSTPRLDPVDHATGEWPQSLGGLPCPAPITLAECGIVKLEPEPQDGPTEYKLHLLLRPRRAFTATSTARFVSGSHLSRSHVSRIETSGGAKKTPPVMAAPTLQSRQNRLQHLTTQLLWRLQQSSPYHSSSTADLVLPRLPEAAAKLGAPSRPEKLLPGLEDSRGALYEIGVSDDGAFVGLAEDEMNESLTNLRAMAASLGCKVDILRTVVVGDCEWFEGGQSPSTTGKVRREPLLVAEALILPDTDIPAVGPALVSPLSRQADLSAPIALNDIPAEEDSQTEQLRVSLTGSTTSGKSSLLGTLSTSTLDNARGKSRLSLLKHRHEIASGVTSSVAPELIGYQNLKHNADGLSSSVVNYGCGNVSSWNDIHNTAERGRLVCLVDSAGHPRYRRTTVRGLISWAPHWTLVCVTADDHNSGSISLDVTSVGSANVSSKAHLELCLKLGLPLVVVITKYDLASKAGLRQTLSRILSVIKDADRKPVLLKPRPPSPPEDFHSISQDDEQEVIASLSESRTIPIVLTSAVTGDGIGKLHALLRHLPIPSPPQPLATREQVPDVLFHIDEVYTKPSKDSISSSHVNEVLVVVSGHLRYGVLSVGDHLSIGPFAQDGAEEQPSQDIHRARSYPSRLGLSTSPSQFALSRRISGDFSTLPTTSHRKPEFRSVKVVSVRNLRLPLRRLRAGQAGTVGIELQEADEDAINRVRKGMVLASSTGEGIVSCSGLVSRFSDKDYLGMQPGALFNLYVASTRAAAKIISVEAVDEVEGNDGREATEGHGVMFGFEEEDHEGDDKGSQDGPGTSQIDVTFQLVSSREWVEVGSQVLVMPANPVDNSVSLDGFVGKVVETLG